MNPAILNDERQRNEFADLFKELSEHHDLSIREDGEWWGYNEEEEHIWISLMAPGQHLCMYMDYTVHNDWIAHYEWIDEKGDFKIFIGYDDMRSFFDEMADEMTEEHQQE